MAPQPDSGVLSFMTGQITIRFYEKLNDFLPPQRRKVAFTHAFNQAGSVKDLIEGLGVPHTEIDLILVNGSSVNFNYRVQDGDHISVYPAFKSLDISPLNRLGPQPMPEPRFVLDTHLGRLTAYLRLLGFDSLYRNDYDDPTLASLSALEQRILLTCDKQLLMRKQITHGYFVRERQPQRQLMEILARFDLRSRQQPFTRCLQCNGEISPVSKESIASQLMPLTMAYYDKFWQCKDCNKIYWQGSHYQRMQRMISTINTAH